MLILVTGGTGLVGKYLQGILTDKGYEVVVLSRAARTDNSTVFYWDVAKNEVDDIVNRCDVIVHLAGANIGAKRWTAKRREEIVESRVKSTELLFDKISQRKSKLKAFVSASAVGYYGAVTTDKVFSEEGSAASDFLGTVCQRWESSVDRFEELGVRVVKLRTGVVLAKSGGVIQKLIKPFKLGMGAALGTGKQFFPWIHIKDICNMYVEAIENEKMKGAYNAIAPESVTNKYFSKSISEAIGKPFFMPNIPSFILKLMFGKMASLFLFGSRISSRKIESEGYKFQYRTLKNALKDVLKSK